MMKLLVSVESFHSLFEWSSVLLLALTFVAAAGTVITSRIINQKQAEKILSLPMFPELTREQVAFVAQVFKEVLQKVK